MAISCNAEIANSDYSYFDVFATSPAAEKTATDIYGDEALGQHMQHKRNACGAALWPKIICLELRTHAFWRHLIVSPM